MGNEKLTPDLIENLQAADGFQAGNPAIGRATPLACYSNEHYKAYPHAEHYSNDKDDPWFVRGYALWKIGLWAIGAYGDSDFGLGPRVDAKISEHLSIWAALTIAFRPNEGAIQSMVGVAADF